MYLSGHVYNMVLVMLGKHATKSPPRINLQGCVMKFQTSIIAHGCVGCVFGISITARSDLMHTPSEHDSTVGSNACEVLMA